MSLENEINRLKRAKSNIRASLKTKIGLDIPEETKLDEYAKCIDDVESTCPHINGDFYSIRTNNGTDYSYLFYSYHGNNLDFLSNWDTSQVTSMGSMFHECSNLTSLDLSNWDTSKVTYMNSMFWNCTSLTSLDLSGFNTNKVTNMAYMFYGCNKLTSLDLSSFDTSKVTDMGSMFYYHSNMNIIHIFGELDLSSLTNGFHSSSYSYPLKGCVNLETLYLKNIYKNCKMTNNSQWCINLGDTNVKDECLIYIIDQLPNLISDKGLTTTTNIILTLPKTNTLTEEQVAVAIDKGWQVANTTYNLAYYNVAYDLQHVICEERLIAKEGMPFRLALFAEDNYYITSVTVTMGDTKITPTYNIDNYGFTTSANIYIGSVTGDINIVAKAKEIIVKCSSFTVGVADPSKNNTLSIAPISSDSVKKILINGKPQTVPTGTYTKSYTVKDGDEIKIGGEFKLANSTLTSISNFELQSEVSSIRNMFIKCSSLTSISFSDKFDTSNVTDMTEMFYFCNKLTSLNLSRFDTSNVTSMHNMFYGCNKLTSLDLSSFDTRNVTSYGNMLYYVSSTCTIYINPDTFKNKKTGTTFTPRELGWNGTFTLKYN